MNNSPDFDPRSSYDQIADLYDADMGQNMPYDDVHYYVERAVEKPGSVLELGCGTGRITLPLLRAGLTVTGADISSGMLSVLRQRSECEADSSERSRLQLVQMDIRQWAIRGSFSTILCPYSLFTYLAESSDRRAFLRQVRQQLCNDGHLILDSFIPDSAIQCGVVMRDYRRALGNGRFLERSKIIGTTDQPQVNIIRRRYSVYKESGERIRTFTTVDRIHYLYPEQLRTLVEGNGFHVACTDWDYGTAMAEPAAHFVTLRCCPD
jgi:SAM-dependent methyltransferase